MNTGTIISQSLLLLLDLYRNHYGLSPDWVPTADDWANFKSEVQTMTAQKFKDEAQARLDAEKPAQD